MCRGTQIDLVNLRKALEAHYGDVFGELSLISRGAGAVFRSGFQQRGVIVKVYPGGAHRSALEGQLRLLIELPSYGIRCPAPLQGTHGSFTTSAKTPISQLTLAVYEEAPGESIGGFTWKQAQNLGATIARLHSVPTHVVPSHYPTMDFRWLLHQPAEAITTELNRLGIDQGPFMSLVDRVERDIAANLTTAKQGVFHGDLHYTNMHFTAGQPTLFDFEHSRVGPTSYDLAFFCLLGNARPNSAPGLQHAFLEGYETETHISDNDLRIVPPLMAAFQIFAMGHHCTYQNARYPKIDRHYMETNLEALRTYGQRETLYAINGTPHRVIGGCLGSPRLHHHDLHPTPTKGNAPVPRT